jgi:Cu2+-exporting ATPase
MILTLITVGKLLESLAKGRTTSAINSLLEMSPKLQPSSVRAGK